MITSNAIGEMYKALKEIGIYRLSCDGLIDAELLAYDAGFSIIEQQLANIVTEYYIDSASEVGVSGHEILLGMETDNQSTLTERKRRICDYYKLHSSTSNKKGLVELIEKIGITAVISESYNSFEININITKINDPKMTIEKAIYYFRLLMPAHLFCSVVYNSNTYFV